MEGGFSCPAGTMKCTHLGIIRAASGSLDRRRLCVLEMGAFLVDVVAAGSRIRAPIRHVMIGEGPGGGADDERAGSYSVHTTSLG